MVKSLISYKNVSILLAVVLIGAIGYGYLNLLFGEFGIIVTSDYWSIDEIFNIGLKFIYPIAISLFIYECINWIFAHLFSWLIVSLAKEKNIRFYSNILSFFLLTILSIGVFKFFFDYYLAYAFFLFFLIRMYKLERLTGRKKISRNFITFSCLTSLLLICCFYLTVIHDISEKISIHNAHKMEFIYNGQIININNENLFNIGQTNSHIFVYDKGKRETKEYLKNSIMDVKHK